MPPKRKGRKVALVKRPADQLTNKQAYYRLRSRFHSNAGRGGVNSKPVQRLCDREWLLKTAAEKVAAGIECRAALIGSPHEADDDAPSPAGEHDGPSGNPLLDPPILDNGAPEAPILVATVEDAREQRKAEAAANLPKLEGRHWRGQQYIDGGTFGVAHLYLELDDNEQILQRVIVKDSWPDHLWPACYFWHGDLRDPATRLPVEIESMQRLKGKGEPGSEVIAQIRGHDVYPAKRSFRIYMSYAEHGTLDDVRNSYMADDGDMQTWVPELAIWSIFEQLNQACILMQWGSLDDNARPAKWEQIVHRDIKPDNVFLGAPSGKSSYPRAVLGDFGLSLITHEGDEMNPLFFGDSLGTRGYIAPEQFMRYNGRTYDPVILAKMLAWTNVWAIGSTLARTMRGKRTLRDEDDQIILDPLEDSPEYESGPEEYEWFDAATEEYYSQELRDLILQCLKYEPAQRPTSLDLRDTIEE